jgi:glucose-6-phosphate 1-dehydrogenase
VPILIRAGKRMPVTQTELRLVFREPPQLPFLGNRIQPSPSQLVVRIDRGTGVRVVLDAHRADGAGSRPIELDMEFAGEGGEDPTPYEVLLQAALDGDPTHFTREDAVEECWRIVAPLLEAPPPVKSYAQGSWGPKDAEALAASAGGWQKPWLPG